MIFSDEDKILIKKFVFEMVHSKEVDRRFSSEKLDKHGINKLLKQLQYTGTLDRRPEI